MSDLPPLNRESATPGTVLNGYERTISADDIEAYVGRTGESLNDYRSGSSLEVPTGMLMGLYGPLIHGTFHYEAGVHVSSDLDLQRTPNVDERLHIDGRIVELFEKNGHEYVTFTVEVSADDGKRLATVAHTSIYALRPREA